MKHLLLVFIYILVSVNASSQNKRVESKGDMPRWTYEPGKDHIVGFGSGATMQEAKQNCVLNIKSQIASSVAANIYSSAELKTSSTTVNNIETQVQAFQGITTSKTGDQGVMMGVSEINATDVYWEKIIDKRKMYIFNYYIKYPFSNFDLSDLVKQYKQKDNELTEDLESAWSKLSNLESLEDIEDCNTVFSYLFRIFTDHRKVKAQLGIDKCAMLINRIDIRDQKSTPGHIRYTLFIDNKSITTNKNPEINSDCVHIEKKLFSDGVYDLVYQFDKCAEGNNGIKINYYFTCGKISKSFLFKVSEQKVNIKPIGKISIRSGHIKNDSVYNSICFISLMSKNTDPVLIKSVTLEWDVFTCTVPLNKIIKGNWIHDISFPLPGIPYALTSIRLNPEITLSGHIDFQFTDKINNVVQRVNIYENEYISSW